MRLLCFICSGLLLLAIADMPMGYYTFLRIVVTIGAILIIISDYKEGINAWVIVFGIIAILFNPIIPIYLHDKELWVMLDIIAAIIFGVKGLRTEE